MSESKFIDLEQIRLKILNEKLEKAMREFSTDSKIQWTSMRLEKPLLETLISLVNEKIE